MSTSIPTLSAGGVAPTRVSRGPTADEWDEMKEHIYEIYIKNGKSLETLKVWMKNEHNFEATTKMYTTKFTKWGPEFSKNNRPDGVNYPRTRVRRLNQVTSSSHNLTLQPRNLDGYEKYRGLLSSTEVYVYGLFDSFNLSADLFDIFVPVDTPDRSSDWQR
ncbi:hypothetical protein NW768_002410 [Fusarium equiseti]|uniref:Clr5 domain-containing protein n=1 Tax=Fusarium equiseti TaxID=61235 RepID=A0ABQ8RP95_FUSEQ|nr:hypothetical protein NW768_002410 [Fusarium equiseti]